MCNAVGLTASGSIGIYSSRYRDGTRVIDRVDYDVPGGAVVNRLFVAGELRRIFAYRKEKLIEQFP